LEKALGAFSSPQSAQRSELLKRCFCPTERRFLSATTSAATASSTASSESIIDDGIWVWDFVGNV
jgi:hypothetical protein